MKTLIKKEIRLLQPAWTIAMLLAIVPRIFVILCTSPGNPPYYQNGLSFIAGLIFAFGLLVLGINSFGQELSCNTFSALLSQPMNRPRIWKIKVATLATAFVLVWLAAILFASLQCNVYQWYFQRNVRPDISNAVEFLTLSALVAFSGGLWTTLLLRQITTAFWITLLAPLTIIWGISAAIQDRTIWGMGVDTFIAAALLLYSAVGFFLARRLFMRAQDIQWTGGEVSFRFGETTSKIRSGPLAIRPRHWFSALAWKELQLHQGTFLIAAIVLVLHLSVAFIRKFHPQSLNSDLEFIFDNFWLLWLLMPLLIGAAAIAEERRLGTLEPQLCLPVSRSVQLFFKFSTALLLSLFFGALIPVLIERYICGASIGDSGLWVIAELQMLHSIDAFNQWHWVVYLAATIFFISFYASSLGRTALQGIGFAIVASSVINSYEASFNPRIGIELLNRYLDVPVLVLVLSWLTFSNFKHAHQNRRFWARNIVALLAVFICTPILAGAIYIRPWELLLPLEPRGPVRITNPAQVRFEANRDTIYALCPDGQLWIQPFTYGIPEIHSGRGQFVGGSNWVDIAVNEFECLALQSNGTLWRLGSNSGPVTQTQIGTDNDWSRVAGGLGGFLLLKKDGSLWAWGTHRSGGDISNPKAALTQKLQRDFASPPAQVSDKTNWTALYSAHLFSPYARGKYGKLWLLAGNHLIQETNVDNQWSSLQFDYGLSYVEVGTNGDLWYSDIRSRIWNHTLGQGSRERLGEPWKWKSAAFGPINGWQTLMAIRGNGTLWNFPHRYPPSSLMGQPVQVGTRSDWIGVSQGFSLASDGSIWTWNRSSKYSWLAPSRLPVCVGNIFEETRTHENPD